MWGCPLRSDCESCMTRWHGQKRECREDGWGPCKGFFNRIVAGWGLRADASTFILQQQAERDRTTTEGVTAKLEMSSGWTQPKHVWGKRQYKSKDTNKKKSGGWSKTLQVKGSNSGVIQVKWHGYNLRMGDSKRKKANLWIQNWIWKGMFVQNERISHKNIKCYTDKYHNHKTQKNNIIN